MYVAPQVLTNLYSPVTIIVENIMYIAYSAHVLSPRFPPNSLWDLGQVFPCLDLRIFIYKTGTMVSLSPEMSEDAEQNKHSIRNPNS